MLDKEVMVKIRRMSELQAVIVRDGDETDETVYAEYRTIKDEVMPSVLPLVEKFVKAGLFTVQLELPEWARAAILDGDVQ
jgi:hypothetical protein